MTGRQTQNRLVWLLVAAIMGGLETQAVTLSCGSALRLARGEGDALPRYAPDRPVDITHVTIDVTPDFDARTIQGTTTIAFTPLVKPLTELKLDAIDLNVASVESTAQLDGYTKTDSSIAIAFSPPIPPGETTTVTIRYDAEPQRGLYFRTPSLGYPQGESHLFTLGECHDGPCWYPNFDYPNERFSSEVICRVPPEMTALSNGRLVSEEIDPQTGLKAFRWLQEKPHVNYLIALAAGRFEKVESRCGDIPLAFYTVPSQIAQASTSLEGTAEMIEFFEQELGVPYPWDRYDQVAVADFVAGGMENTSMTILTDGTLFTRETENIRSSQDLVAHELVHQWMGDLVTCKDWSHLWLNEGFAVYYETLYDGHCNGQDAMLYKLVSSARGITSHADDRPIVDRRYKDADEQFDYRAYAKGGWVVHMLRCQLGDDLYHRVIRTYLERHALGTVVTEDLRRIVEELSGRTFDRFFDQWLYRGGCPSLEVAYEWLQEDKLAKITVRQTQAGEPFVLPTQVRFCAGGQTLDRDIVIDAAQHDFYFALAAEPTIVRFDPELTLLAKVKFDPPREMLYAQLANQADVVGRLLAVEALKREKDRKTIARLKDAVNKDSFYGVRVEAASALQEIRTDEAFDALVDSMEQSDARVRLRVVQAVGAFYRPEVPTCMETILADEKNPEILMAAIRSLGRFHSPRTRETVSQYLQSTSYRNELAVAAIDAIGTLNDPTFVPELTAVLRDREVQFGSWDFAHGLDVLARIASDQDDHTKVREFLVSCVNCRRSAVRGGALSALGTLGDPKAIPVVETFCGDDRRDSVQRRARDAMDRLREKKPLVPAEIVELRRAVDELRKEVETLKGQLDDVKKQNRARAQDALADDKASGQSSEGE
jgi:aminopeptidase N